MKLITYTIKSIAPYLRSKAVGFLLLFMFMVIVMDLLFPIPYLKQFSKAVYSKEGTLLSAFLTPDDKWRLKTELEEISPDLIKAILEKEDKWFYWHPGFNPIAIVRALYQNISRGKRISGASTITMQLARMINPSARTYFNKLLESIRAFQLELHFSKREILEMYLSLLPYGGNIEGVKSASYIYFNRPPQKLSLSQVILLSVIPNDPNSFRLDKSANDVLKMRNKWINNYIGLNTFSNESLKDALNEPVSINRYKIQNEAPHFSQYIIKNYKGDNIRTALDLSIQKTSERLLLNYVNRVRSKNISNGAIIIIENKTNSVVGYCGSADFNDNSSSGQVNGITALRSPGSTLKPILYSLAFDNGILTPEMKLLDIPIDISGYEPENFDLKFNGEVSARFALVNSLNIPAVRLLLQVGLEKIVSLLSRAGFSDIERQKKNLGLSLILGGCGVRLEQITRFFSLYSKEGKLYPLNYLYNKSLNEEKSVQIFSKEAAFITSQILASNERPDFPSEFLFNTNLPKIAWKTGTSYGKRDAWAIGYNPNYTIGVWMGNFDGKGAPELSGAEMSVPLLFELFNAVDYKPKKKWFDRPKEVGEREVCSETGLLLTQNCSHFMKDFFIKRVSPNIKCTLYKTLYVNEKESHQFCAECLPKEGYKKVNYPMYGNELTLWYIKNKVEFKRQPPHNPECQARKSGIGPTILSPSPDYEYYIETNSNQQILLQAASDPSVKIHYWYVNGEFYKSSKPGEKIFFISKENEISVTCMDDLGRKSMVSIKIIFY